jgi:uncharacterized Zn-binding protein involved in type VI secretion
MSKPAARIGDTTAHGGSIVLGLPTVLIGGMPAARLGDMHVCPMMTPGVPPIPHVGGPITLGSAGVMIGGVPAARMGDMCTCVGPPDTILMGCPTVLIGEVGAGSASGGGGGGGGGAAGARASAAAATIDTGVTTTQDEHWIEFQFVDSAGLPVAGVPYAFTDPDGVETEGVLRVDGRIRTDGVSEGEGEVVLRSVYGAAWSKTEARPDEEVSFSATADGFDDGTPATVQVWKTDLSGADAVVDEIQAQVQGGKVEGAWAYVHPDPSPGDPTPAAYTSSTYYVAVAVGPCRALSDALTIQDSVEIELRDEENRPSAGQDYVLYLPNGDVRTGTLDGNGYAKEDKVPPGPCTVRFPGQPGTVRMTT